MKVHHFQVLVIGALCLGAVVLAAETYNHHQQLAELQAAARNTPANPIPPLRRSIDALNTQLTVLQPQVAALGDALRRHATAQATLGQQLDELAASVRVLQAAPSGPSSADLIALTQRVDTAEAAVEKLSAAPAVPAAGAAPTAATTRNGSEVKTPEPPFTPAGYRDARHRQVRRCLACRRPRVVDRAPAPARRQFERLATASDSRGPGRVRCPRPWQTDATAAVRR